MNRLLRATLLFGGFIFVSCTPSLNGNSDEKNASGSLVGIQTDFGNGGFLELPVPKKAGYTSASVSIEGTETDASGNYYTFGAIVRFYEDTNRLSLIQAPIEITGFVLRFSPLGALTNTPWTFFEFFEPQFGYLREFSTIKEVNVQGGYLYVFGEGASTQSAPLSPLETDLIIARIDLSTGAYDSTYGVKRIHLGMTATPIPLRSYEVLQEVYQLDPNSVFLGYQTNEGTADGSLTKFGLTRFTLSAGVVDSTYGTMGFNTLPATISRQPFYKSLRDPTTLNPFGPPLTVDIATAGVNFLNNEYVASLSRNSEQNIPVAGYGNISSGYSEIVRSAQALYSGFFDISSGRTAAAIVFTQGGLPTQSRLYRLTPRGGFMPSFGPVEHPGYVDIANHPTRGTLIPKYIAESPNETLIVLGQDAPATGNPVNSLYFVSAAGVSNPVGWRDLPLRSAWTSFSAEVAFATASGGVVLGVAQPNSASNAELIFAAIGILNP